MMNSMQKCGFSVLVASMLFATCLSAAAAASEDCDEGAMMAAYSEFRSLIPKGSENAALLIASASNLTGQAFAALALGANIETTDSNGNTPLHKTMCGQIETAQLLLRYGANLDAKNNLGWTPLHWAVLWDSVPMAELLLQNGAKIGEKTNGCETPLDMAKRRDKEPKDKVKRGVMVKLLKNHGAGWDCCLQ